ncbi:histidine kinase [Tolypothrix sp. VBCCA 56010]
MGNGQWVMGSGETRGQGDKETKRNYLCPMPNAQCPMPHAQCPMP